MKLLVSRYAVAGLTGLGLLMMIFACSSDDPASGQAGAAGTAGVETSGSSGASASTGGAAGSDNSVGGGSAGAADACAGSLERCPEACVDTNSDVNNCGTCGHACPQLESATTTCADRVCRYACAKDHLDCNGDLNQEHSDGCEGAFDCARTVLISKSAAGAPGDEGSLTAALSSDGRFIAFYSEAKNLIEGDTNGHGDVFLFDRLEQRLERVSLSNSEVQGNGRSRVPSISDDGRYVTFVSDATNLIDGDTAGAEVDTNGVPDVFIRDRVEGTTKRVNLTADGKQADKGADDARITPDARYIVFASSSTNLPSAATSTVAKIFVRERESGVTECISDAAPGVAADAAAVGPSISADGQLIAFGSTAWNLVGSDQPKDVQIFVHDRRDKSKRRVSVNANGQAANSYSDSARISRDGKFVVFASAATNLVDADTNGRTDVFLHDLTTNKTSRVNVAADGSEPLIGAQEPDISADGSRIAYRRVNRFSGSGGVYVHDRGTGKTELVSVGAAGERARLFNFSLAISGNGRWVAYASYDQSQTTPAPFQRSKQQLMVSRVTGDSRRPEPTLLKSCREIKAAFGAAPSGIYDIDVDGDGPIQELSVACDMNTAGGGWTVLYATNGADNHPALTSDKVVSGLGLVFDNLNESRLLKVELSKISTETLFLRQDGTTLGSQHHLIANRAPFSERLLEANQNEDFAVKLRADNGVEADAFMGYSNHKNLGGGDFSLSVKSTDKICGRDVTNGLDHHSDNYLKLNCNCNRQYLYSYSYASLSPQDADADAGYDVSTALGSWVATQACDQAEGGKLKFLVAVR